MDSVNGRQPMGGANVVSGPHSRREWLRAGGLSTLGLTLPQLWAGRSRAAGSPVSVGRASFGRARRCLVLFMFGAPAHQDLWDLKPHAPSGVRGEFQPIPSVVPDLFVGEHLPRLAQRTDRFAQIRSVTHPDNTHTVAMHYMLTGRRHLRPASNPQNAADDFPCFGAVAQHLGNGRDWYRTNFVGANTCAGATQCRGRSRLHRLDSARFDWNAMRSDAHAGSESRSHSW